MRGWEWKGEGRLGRPWTESIVPPPPLVDEGLLTLDASKEAVEMFKARYSGLLFSHQGEGSNQNR